MNPKSISGVRRPAMTPGCVVQPVPGKSHGGTLIITDLRSSNRIYTFAGRCVIDLRSSVFICGQNACDSFSCPSFASVIKRQSHFSTTEDTENTEGIAVAARNERRQKNKPQEEHRSSLISAHQTQYTSAGRSVINLRSSAFICGENTCSSFSCPSYSCLPVPHFDPRRRHEKPALYAARPKLSPASGAA